MNSDYNLPDSFGTDTEHFPAFLQRMRLIINSMLKLKYTQVSWF